MFAASKTDSASTGGYQISRSLRFNSADTTNLNRTFASAGNRRTFTLSFWLKRSRVGVDYEGFFASGNGTDQIRFENIDQLRFSLNSTASGDFVTTQVFRDVSAWYHIVFAVDTTQATSTNRVKIYVNGSQITSFTTSSYPTLNYDCNFNNNVSHRLGIANDTSYPFNGYITETYLIDGQALTPSSFGETNAQTGVWQPKAYSGSYGTNGFYLNFSDNSNTTAATLGKDYSGNGNNWTPNNFSVTAGIGNDSFVDSPTSYGTDAGVGGEVRGNYATVNPFQLISNVAVSNGNLYFQSNNNADQWASAPSTIAVRTGKWYAEFTPTNVAGSPDYMFGVARASWSPIILDGGGYYGRWWYTTEGYSYYSNGSFYTGNSIVSSAASYVTSNVIGVALDLDAGSITFYKNGVSQGTPFTSIPLGVDYVFAGGVFTNPYPTPTNIGAFFANFGQRAFAYTAPSGFKALCTQNLPTPTIGATTATQASKYFGVTLRNGGGSGGGTYSTTIDMASGALLWDKPRSISGGHYLVDSVRGISKTLSSDSTSAEATYTTWFTGFNNGSFTTGASDWNTNVTVVDWMWAANGSGSTNTAGSITSTVSANTTSGFSIVTYTGTGSAATVGHGLGVAPSMIICKGRSVGGNYWQTQHSALGPTKALFLNTTDAAFTNAAYWNNTAPTSTVFSLGGNTDANGNGTTYVAYCFAEVAGYSKMGSYTGNGSTDGPFAYCGFRPAFIMFKNTTDFNWQILDASRAPYNQGTVTLFPNLSSAENTTATQYDILSNGFKIRTSDAGSNGSGNSIIFMAFAENPFKYSLAR
jgi:hypothetical protein